MSNRTAFESQCDKISEELENLSDWEKEFYLYCLLPWLADRMEAEAKAREARNGYDYMAKEHMRRDVARLRMIRESLTYDLF